MRPASSRRNGAARRGFWPMCRMCRAHGSDHVHSRLPRRRHWYFGRHGAAGVRDFHAFRVTNFAPAKSCDAVGADSSGGPHDRAVEPGESERPQAVEVTRPRRSSVRRASERRRSFLCDRAEWVAAPAKTVPPRSAGAWKRMGELAQANRRLAPRALRARTFGGFRQHLVKLAGTIAARCRDGANVRATRGGLISP